MSTQEKTEQFLRGDAFAVVGASQDRAKYGNKVLRAYLQQGRTVYPVNPKAAEVEGLPAFKRLSDLPSPVHGVSIITPPEETEGVVDEALALGVGHIWMQPGAESGPAVARAAAAGANVIAGDACVLVVLGYRERSA